MKFSIFLIFVYYSFVNGNVSRQKRALVVNQSRVWDRGIIPYTISDAYSQEKKKLVKKAMNHWENYTCIKFIERDPQKHKNYVFISEKTCGCCSDVGNQRKGEQSVSLGKGCDVFGIVVHELGHAVGFYHEHVRPDRDKYIDILWDNIKPNFTDNFVMEGTTMNSLNQPYDYNSIMHYSDNQFSVNKKKFKTILPKVQQPGQVRPKLGQRERLSDGDILQANLLYKCNLCSRNFNNKRGSFESPKHLNGLDPISFPARCDWRITASPGERIVLNINWLDKLKSVDCNTNYLEIWDGYLSKDLSLGRFCGDEIPNEILSISNQMLVSYFTSPDILGHKGFAADYKAVCGADLFVNDEDNNREDRELKPPTPSHPKKYQQECIWRLSVPEKRKVELVFENLMLGKNQNCQYGYVEVRNGYMSSSPLVGIFCGGQPEEIYSTGKELFVRFVRYENSPQEAGFVATVQKGINECDSSGCEHFCINTVAGHRCYCKAGFQLTSDEKCIAESLG